ncbi:MAG: fibronectin type III domain-containing protein [Chlorobium sp.]|nr:fibronectin type III domain-containing protein [Chlorobium sp.]
MRTKYFGLLFLAVFLLSPISANSWAAECTFSWLPNTESNLAGYKIHYGTASKSYPITIDIGKPALVDGRVTATVSNLNNGVTYYFAATAYDTTGQQSGYSSEAVCNNPPLIKSIMISGL